ncbi:hypothetical protein QFZ32_000648 [Streptomyces canus]|nr:hypothetical protein [Streptomyces canus]
MPGAQRLPAKGIGGEVQELARLAGPTGLTGFPPLRANTPPNTSCATTSPAPGRQAGSNVEGIALISARPGSLSAWAAPGLPKIRNQPLSTSRPPLFKTIPPRFDRAETWSCNSEARPVSASPGSTSTGTSVPDSSWRRSGQAGSSTLSSSSTSRIPASSHQHRRRSPPGHLHFDPPNEMISKRSLISVFYPGIGCLVCGVGPRQEMVFSPVRRWAIRSVMARWITASERLGRAS